MDTNQKELCKICNHLWDDHLLKGKMPNPVEGWMECPVEGCTCRRTWSIDPKYLPPAPAADPQKP